ARDPAIWRAGGRMKKTRVLATALALAAGQMVATFAGASPAHAATNPCAPAGGVFGGLFGSGPVSPIGCENTKQGDPQSDWLIPGSGDPTLQGFATSMGVNVGKTESFKISSTASSYHVDILRLGYYQGYGARKIASGLRPSTSPPPVQPPCLTDASTGL